MRKPAGSETTSRRPRLPLPDVRRRIWESACDLVASGDTREVSAVLASRFNTGERVIDQILVLEGIKHERIAATLRTGVLNALELARDVESDTREAGAA